MESIARGSKFERLTYATGQKRSKRHLRAMSALPPKADKEQTCRYVRFVPKADIPRCSKLAPVSAAFLRFLVGPHHGGGRDRRNDLAGSYDRTRVVRDIDVEGSMHHLV